MSAAYEELSSGTSGGPEGLIPADPAKPERSRKREKIDETQAALASTLARAISGDRDAFDEIVFLYRDQVYGVCWHATRNMEDALDVTQDVFMRVWRALPSFRAESKFSTWLHRIVLNTVTDHIRRERRHKHSPPAQESTTESDSSASSDIQTRYDASVAATQRQAVYAAELHRALRAAIAKLSSRQREVFVLRYWQDMELKAISTTLGCSDGAVKRHLHRANERLRSMLKDLMPGKGGKR